MPARLEPTAYPALPDVLVVSFGFGSVLRAGMRRPGSRSMLLAWHKLSGL